MPETIQVGFNGFAEPDPNLALVQSLDHFDLQIPIEIEAGTEPCSFSWAGQRQPLGAREPLYQQELEFPAGGGTVGIETSRDDPGVIDDQEVPWVQEFWKVVDTVVTAGTPTTQME